MDRSDRFAEALRALERGDTSALADLIRSGYVPTMADADALDAATIAPVPDRIERRAQLYVRFRRLRDTGMSKKARFAQIKKEFPEFDERTIDAIINSRAGYLVTARARAILREESRL